MAHNNTKYYAFVLNNEAVDAYETMVETALLFVKSQKPPFEKYIKMNGLAYEALQILEKLHLQIKKDIFADDMIDTPTTKILDDNKKNNGIVLK